ncbi:glycine cleavage system protein H [Saccharolobus solfataricus]|uniref:Probable glycine cleavage system H protein 2 n=3 Tax=Saccharolobus solfataricus TaxID=2287 RepID=GCSH2_SACS2|nr:glycine cleavage system protein H [Saccharolobus solfataricus]Q97Z69.1 RecName: Full=Probable glycine cleavage system H protein 2 [Saccharolobus solfataricus P2]AAK41324.1 Glycine cleavage system protein H [Saccharolobus solfataricus P2]AKA74268.1 glycine cleavage system protein H [Saccharolobus solfataricus]AKA76965.1 glycine cleavage system protein H [Saccharolobus solfataricus]AKA79657.1 glycine cleavage system protein H [Saccharolobus solfataricus]AZF68750.1 glycine cleavage system pro
MVVESNCEIPENLYYFIEGKNTVWAKLESPDTIVVGITDLAQTMAGKIVKVRIKKKGTKVEKGRPVATMESGKWAGPVPAPVTGEVVEVNAEAEKSPIIINQDPYGKGWLVKMKMSNPEELKQLFSGQAAIQKLKELIASEKLTCKRL